MNVFKRVVSIFILALLISDNVNSQDLDEQSVYQLESDWQTVAGEQVKLNSLTGKVQVVAFVYTYCQHSCPVIMQRLKQIEKHLPATSKDQVQFTLFTLDPERDTVEQLKAFAKKDELDLKHWQLMRGDADDVLELAAVLGVKYKPMNNESKDIAHSNMITVLDKQGVISHQVKGLGEQLSDAVAAITALTQVDTAQ